MPILPENKKRYPADWKAIRDKILSECQNKCEWCGVENGAMRGDKKIVLTIAHLDHVPEHCARENLRALCQKCHNGYDAKHRAQTRKRHFAVGQYELFEEAAAWHYWLKDPIALPEPIAARGMLGLWEYEGL